MYYKTVQIRTKFNEISVKSYTMKKSYKKVEMSKQIYGEQHKR